MKSKLWYFGFFSVFSFLYFIEKNSAFLWFLAFIPYFATYKVDDERLKINLGRATTNSFLFTIFFGMATISYIYLTNQINLFAPAFIIILGGSLIICLISLFIYDKTAK